jgi:hypothetical protein
VHINAEFTGTRPTDHDPQLALLRVAITPHDVVLAGGTVAENLPAGTIVGTLSATDTPGDTLTYTCSTMPAAASPSMRHRRGPHHRRARLSRPRRASRSRCRSPTAPG